MQQPLPSAIKALALTCLLALAASLYGCGGRTADPPPPEGLKDSSLEMSLWRGAQGCDPNNLRNLIQAGAQVNTWKGPELTTPLMEAVRSYGDACPRQNVEILLAAGANPNLRDRFGNTALHWAVRTECIQIYQDMVSLLLANGADPTITNNECQTPMMLATKSGCNEKVGLLAQALAARQASDQPTTPLSEECLKRQKAEQKQADQKVSGDYPPGVAAPPAPAR